MDLSNTEHIKIMNKMNSYLIIYQWITHKPHFVHVNTMQLYYIMTELTIRRFIIKT